MSEFSLDWNVRVKSVLETTLRNESYVHSKTGEWAERIASSLSEHYRGVDAGGMRWKYIHSVVLMQREDGASGGGFKTYSEAIWDLEKDECVSHRWENQTIRAIVTVWRISF